MLAAADLIVKRQFTETRNVLGPLDNYEQLLLNRVADVTHSCHLLLQHVHAAHHRRYLQHARISQHFIIITLRFH